MPDSSPPDSTRTEVEAEIGRSLLFFQSLERTQKELLRLSGLSVTLAPQQRQLVPHRSPARVSTLPSFCSPARESRDPREIDWAIPPASHEAGYGKPAIHVRSAASLSA